MKNKIFIIGFLFIGILVGCDLGNTPTSKVEALLSEYQMLDDTISISHIDLSYDINIADAYKKRYEDLIRSQYRNMSYEIKEEEIDGETANVTVQIEVIDYQKILDQYSNSFNDNEYHKKVLEALENAKDKITYTIEFNVKMDKNGNWNVEELDEKERGKLLGINNI